MIKYAITFYIITPEAAELGEFESQGYEEQGEFETVRDFLAVCNNYGFSSNSENCGTRWLETQSPEIDYITGEHKYFNLHIDDGNQFSRLNKVLRHIENKRYNRIFSF